MPRSQLARRGGLVLAAAALASFACSGRVSLSRDTDPDATAPLPIGEAGAPPTDLGPSRGGRRSSVGARSSGEGGALDVALEGGAGGAASGPADVGAVGGATSTPSACASPVADNWTAPLGASLDGWLRLFGNPSVDTNERQLILTFDDITERGQRLTGGYFVEMTVSLEGGTALAPLPDSNQGPFPALRRSAHGSAIELGMTMYGIEQKWSSVGWPEAGASLIGTTRVELTYYVKAGARAVAAKVRHGDAVLRSRWVLGVGGAEILRLVGLNHSRVYAASDAVYVGPVTGCERLSDAEVEGRYLE